MSTKNVPGSGDRTKTGAEEGEASYRAPDALRDVKLDDAKAQEAKRRIAASTETRRPAK